MLTVIYAVVGLFILAGLLGAIWSVLSIVVYSLICALAMKAIDR